MSRGAGTRLSFANSKDAPTLGLLAERFLPLSGFCFIPVGLQVLMDGPLSCSPSYYGKGPRIGPNRRDHQLDSWPAGIPGTYREARQSRAICHSLIGSPPCWISPENTVTTPSLHPVFSRCTPPTPEHQEQQDSNAFILQTLTLQAHTPQRNGLSFSWSRLVQAAAVPFVCSDGPAKLRYFLIHRDVFMLCGPRRPLRWKHTLRVKATMSLSLGYKHSVIPKALFFTQRMKSDGDLGAQLAALGLTQHRANCPSPKSLFSDTERHETGSSLGRAFILNDTGTVQGQCRIPLRTLRCR